MKKLFLSLLAICGMALQVNATDLSELKNAIYVESATVRTGTDATLSIKLKNEVEVKMLGCLITLPTGLTAGELEASKGHTNFAPSIFAGNAQDEAKTIIKLGVVTGVGTYAANKDGEIGTLVVSVPTTMTPGDYKVSVSEIQIQNAANDEVITLSEAVETTITVTDRITLDENATEAPAAAEGVNVKVLRTINANEWSTICLPFAMTKAQVADAFGDNVELADFTGIVTKLDTDLETVIGITVNFESVGEALDYSYFEANHPYIIKVQNAVSEILADNVNIAAEEASVDCDEFVVGKGKTATYFYNSFIGNYVAGTEVPENTLFLNGGKFYYSKGKNTIKAFRGYFDFYDVLTEVEGAVKAFISIDGVADGVVELQNNVKANGAIFNLAGQRVSKAQKGIFIQNGKKTVIK